MYNPHKLPVSHHPRLALVLLTGVALVLSACATGPDLDLTIHESERGGVYVERISDRSFQAAHPIALSADTMAWVFSGEVVKVNRGLLENLVAGKPEAVRAFRDEDVEYLAPLLVEGLTRTASDQRLGFVSVKRGRPRNRRRVRSTPTDSHCRTYPRCFSARWSSSPAKSTASAISRIDFRKSILCR